MISFSNFVLLMMWMNVGASIGVYYVVRTTRFYNLKFGLDKKPNGRDIFGFAAIGMVMGPLVIVPIVLACSVVENVFAAPDQKSK